MLKGVCNIDPDIVVKLEIIFGTGVYAGVYLAQNYQIDKVEDPKALLEKAQNFIKSKLAEVNDGKKGND